MDELQDVIVEAAVIGGLYQFGINAFIETTGILNDKCFVDSTNTILYKCLVTLFNRGFDKVDAASLRSIANELGFEFVFTNKSELSHIKQVLNTKIDYSNIKNFAGRLRKILTIKELQKISRNIYDKLGELTASESFNEILSTAEEPLLNYSLSLNETNSDVIEFKNELDPFIHQVETCPIEHVGLSSGFSSWDLATSALRNKTISLICGRAKSAKSLLGGNIALNIASRKIPTLIVDSELDKNTWMSRMLASLLYKQGHRIKTNDLETGKYTKYAKNIPIVRAAKDILKTYPISYVSVANNTFDQILSFIKKWRYKNSGQVFVMYDYIKVTQQEEINKNIAEHQRIGFLTIALHNLCVKYDFPLLTFAQLNRQGEEDETQSSIAFSDRLIHSVTNCSFIRDKSDIEIADDGIMTGTKKLVIIASRYAKGLQRNDYINLKFDGDYGHIEELGTKFEMKTLQLREQELAAQKDKEENLNFGEL